MAEAAQSRSSPKRMMAEIAQRSPKLLLRHTEPKQPRDWPQQPKQHAAAHAKGSQTSSSSSSGSSSSASSASSYLLILILLGFVLVFSLLLLLDLGISRLLLLSTRLCLVFSIQKYGFELDPGARLQYQKSVSRASTLTSTRSPALNSPKSLSFRASGRTQSRPAYAARISDTGNGEQLPS